MKGKQTDGKHDSRFSAEEKGRDKDKAREEDLLVGFDLDQETQLQVDQVGGCNQDDPRNGALGQITEKRHLDLSMKVRVDVN